MLQRYQSIVYRAKVIVIGLFVFGFLIFLGTFFAFLRTPLVPVNAQPTNIIFKTGSSVVTLADELKQRGMLVYPKSYLVIWTILTNSARHLHAGEYLIKPGMSPSELLNDMMLGRVVWRDFTIIEGWTLADTRKALDANPYLEHRTKNLSEKQLAAFLNSPHDNLEGLLFPDTYKYTAGQSDSMILKQSYQVMQQRLQNAWQNRAPNLFYKDVYQALIVASMVEKEARLEQDRPKIAGVILKRLQLGMPLQIDAAVIYGLGSAFNGRLTLNQLKIPGPYNTYLNKGLPPTPIAMPGNASIQAALHPIIGKDLFYVATGDGGHVFSATMAEQNRAVARYRAVERKGNKRAHG